MSKWVKFGKWKWSLDIVDSAQNYQMRDYRNYGLSLEEVLHKHYSAYKVLNQS
jgi:hypothetical protein